ncbi:carbonic anhydrase [Micromonospora endolithica]|nr:carbonic anhydrase [Micromonospora endolithica]
MAGSRADAVFPPVDLHPLLPPDRQRDSAVDRPAALFACSDPHADIDSLFTGAQLYTVRTAGLAIGPAVLASLEYAIEQMNAALVIILGHDVCRLPGSTPDTRIRHTAAMLRKRSNILTTAVSARRCYLVGLCWQDRSELIRPVTLDDTHRASHR